MSIISVENLSKQYRIGTKVPYKTFREAIVNVVASPARLFKRNGLDEDNTIWALKDVSFEVQEGEVLGIIGRNGAGKSTLLKILSRVTEPTKGEVKIRGRVGSLLEVGTGFHPELTGRENIFLNGAILGMRKEEIKRKFDEIVAFAEIEKFLDTPVKRYSSGMYVRLAFAVAAHLEPEVLLVDEILAVGDAQFQKKCLGKMGEVAKGGRTVLFVSHNMGAVSALCSRGILFHNGLLLLSGLVETIIDLYITKGTDNKQNKIQRITGSQNDTFAFTNFWIEDEKGNIVDHVNSGGYAAFVIEYTSKVASNDFSIAFGVFDILGNRITRLSMIDQNLHFFVNKGQGKSICIFDKVPFSAGRYYLTFGAYKFGHPVKIESHAVSFDVVDADYYGKGAIQEGLRLGPILVDHKWTWER
jgi:lipopolysaccharide transport system ATP-binding protein